MVITCRYINGTLKRTVDPYVTKSVPLLRPSTLIIVSPRDLSVLQELSF